MKVIEHREEKWAFSFVEISPDEKKENLPIIIQLHGAGEVGNGKEELQKVEVHGFSKLFRSEEKDCILIMPQCPRGTFWCAKIESLLLFIEEIIEEYKVDKSRVYLTGISMGGFGTWFTAMAKPSLFAAIAPVCGGGMPWNAGSLDMPVFTIHGLSDSTVSPVLSEQMVEALESLGRDVTYVRLEGVGHNAWDYTYDNDLYHWLLSKKR